MIGHSKHGAKDEHTLVSLLIAVCRERGRTGGLWGQMRQEDLEEARDSFNVLKQQGHEAHTHPLRLASCALCSSCPDGLAEVTFPWVC